MKRHYFDHNATTPVAPEALQAMLPYLEGCYGNASSIHTFGQDARSGVERARRQVAALLNAQPKEIVFTGGGTEADNLAILGVVHASAKPSKHVITSTIEHPGVLNTCRHLEDQGVDVTYLSAGSRGVVSVDDLHAAMRPETVLITIMHANNELGTIQPITEIAKLAAEAGIPFHTDGVQSAGKLATDVQELGVDLFALSGHKIYAPKGVGALYVRKGTVLEPVLFGGSHERGRRPGTENVPGIVALGEAATLAHRDLTTEGQRLTTLRDRLQQGILASVESAIVNGDGIERTPNTTNIRFDHIEGEAMVIALDLKGFAVSSGAACSSGAVKPSHVLTAIGLSTDQAKSSIRFSLGHETADEDVDALLEAIPQVVGHLRNLSPAYAG